jgi:hypothetical protein
MLVLITSAVIGKPIKYRIICSNRDDLPVRFQRIKEAEIKAASRNGAPKIQGSGRVNGRSKKAYTARRGEIYENRRNIETIPDNPAMVRSH